MTLATLLLTLFVLLAAGTPVGFAMAIAGVCGLAVQGGASMVLGVLSTVPVSSISAYELITIPMFLLMAEMVLLSGVADDLFTAASAWIGRVPGGLAMATAVAGAGFGAICGTSTASAATLSSTSLPAMIRQGYEPSLAAGVVAISGTLAMLLPTSIALIVYGLIADVNIGQLLISGIIPACIVLMTILATVYILVRRDPSRAPRAAPITWAQRFALLSKVGPMLLLFGVVTGTIYLGVATPTEASAVGALGAFCLALVRRRPSLPVIFGSVERAAVGSCMIIMILMGASLFSFAFTLTMVTQDLVSWVGSLGLPRYGVICALLCGYILLGSFMDQLAILVLTVPIVLPLIKSLGFDPIWFGVIKIVTAEVGIDHAADRAQLLRRRPVCEPAGGRGVRRDHAAFLRPSDRDRDSSGIPGPGALASLEDVAAMDGGGVMRRCALLLSMMLLAAGGSAHAAEPRHLRVADSFPPDHYLIRLLLKPWMDEVTRRTNGAVVFDHFPAQELGKAGDLLSLTQTGVVDIGYIAPSYASDKMPLSEVAQLPTTVASTCVRSLAYWKVARQGVVQRSDYAPNGIHLLLALNMPPYHIMTTARPIATEADLRGLKLRSTGGTLDLSLRAIGATPVRMAAPDTYEALSRHTLDGAAFALEGVLSYHLEKLIRYEVENINVGSIVVAYSISERTFRALPQDVQRAMDEAGDAIIPQACAKVEESEAGMRQQLNAAGITFGSVPPAVEATLRNTLAGVRDVWAQDLQRRGKPATEAIAEYDAAVTSETH